MRSLLEAFPTNTGMRTPSPDGWAQRIWAGPFWMASAPRCWWTMAPESTQWCQLMSTNTTWGCTQFQSWTTPSIPFGDHIPLVGLGGGQAEPLGFTLMRVQIEGMPHYDEQQVIFVLDDPSPFSTRIPVILGTPTINRVVQTMTETEMHSAPTEWQTARVAYEWAQGFQFRRASLGERLKFPTNMAEDPLDLDEKVLLTDKCMIPGFQSVIAHGCTQRTMMMGNQLNVMTQAPYPDDKADLPNGLYVMRTYTELKDGSRNVSVVLRNLTTRPIHLARRWVISQVATTNAVPEAQCSPELLKQLNDESKDKPEPAKLSTQQRQDRVGSS